MAEDEMVRQYHRLNGHESDQTPGDSEGQGCLVSRSPSDGKELDTTQRLNNNRKITGLYSSKMLMSCKNKDWEMFQIKGN